MDRNLDLLTLVMLLDPCLTADEAAREAAARRRLMAEVKPERREPRPAPRREPDAPAVGF
jgi:hypothetical protein